MARTVTTWRTLLRSLRPTPSTLPSRSPRPTLEELETRLAPAGGLTVIQSVIDDQSAIIAKVDHSIDEAKEYSNIQASRSSDTDKSSGKGWDQDKQTKQDKDNKKDVDISSVPVAGPALAVTLGQGDSTETGTSSTSTASSSMHPTAVQAQSPTSVRDDSAGTGTSNYDDNYNPSSAAPATSGNGSGQSLAGLGFFLTASQTSQPGPGGQSTDGQGDNRGNNGAPNSAGLPPSSDSTVFQYALRSTQTDEDEVGGEKQVRLSGPNGQLLGELPQGELEVEAGTAPQAELVVVPAVVQGPRTDRATEAGAGQSEALALPALQMLSQGLEDGATPDQASPFSLPQNVRMGAALRGVLDQLLNNLTLPPLAANPEGVGEDADVIPPAGDGAQPLDDSAAGDFAFLSASNQGRFDGSGWEVPVTLALMPLLLSARLEGLSEEQKHRKALLS